jgi:hypothetical protein
MENVTEEQFMSMSDEERAKYIIGVDMAPDSELDHSSYEDIERLQYNAYFEDTILKEMHLKEKEIKLDPEESSEMFKQMIPTDWLKEDIEINTNIGRESMAQYVDSHYEDIRRINILLWKVYMNVDLNEILQDYDRMRLDNILEDFIDMGKYHVIENAFHKDFNNNNDELIKRIVLSAKLHDLAQICHTMYRVGKIIKAKENKK